MDQLRIRHSFDDADCFNDNSDCTEAMCVSLLSPISYTCRFRVGRGNRLVLDRIPCYDESLKDDYCYMHPEIIYTAALNQISSAMVNKSAVQSSVLKVPTLPASQANFVYRTNFAANLGNGNAGPVVTSGPDVSVTPPVAIAHPSMAHIHSYMSSKSQQVFPAEDWLVNRVNYVSDCFHEDDIDFNVLNVPSSIDLHQKTSKAHLNYINVL
jgi:hypothetical protein